jgi:HEAT repeat protein
VGTPRWTPEAGTRTLVERLGATAARSLLGHLAAGRVPTAAMVDSPYAEVIGCIGRCDAATFLRDGAAEHLAYWPRSWAARSLGHLGEEDAAASLVDAFADPHWRVRMAAARALGQVAADGYDDELATLVTDPHPRVRAAAALALGRIGSEFALPPLRDALEDGDGQVRRAADQALARVERRLLRYRR